MRLHELAQKVREMRDAQKRWFKGDKSPQVLDASKRLEREVDRIVSDVLDAQTKLFD